MGIQKTLAGALVAAAMTIAPFAAHAENKPVDITFGGKSTAQVMHKGKLVTIQRVQDNGNNVDASFAKTSRPCPPFCIQPISLAPGVETIGENEIEEKPYFSFFDNIFLITDLGEFLITDTGERLVID